MNEWKKKCVGLQRTWVSKRTVLKQTLYFDKTTLILLTRLTPFCEFSSKASAFFSEAATFSSLLQEYLNQAYEYHRDKQKCTSSVAFQAYLELRVKKVWFSAKPTWQRRRLTAKEGWLSRTNDKDRKVGSVCLVVESKFIVWFSKQFCMPAKFRTSTSMLDLLRQIICCEKPLRFHGKELNGQLLLFQPTSIHSVLPAHWATHVRVLVLCFTFLLSN